RQAESCYFLPTGQSYSVKLDMPDVPIAQAFEQAEVVAAIRASQQGKLKYPEFLARTRASGCVGYVVWIAGRHVAYFGRRGETHIEHFPPKSS
ncbi:MAG TPA: hypothetical protein VMF89_06930, partial [Polyangiales bacterium]|nr:hypothetical protein [Polyangiales bacterium]